MTKEKQFLDQQKIILAGLLLAAALVQGCTKKVAFEGLPKEAKTHVVDKSLLDLQGQYLYSSSQ